MKQYRNIKKKILTDLKVELLDEFDQNFTRKAFFDRPWPERSYPVGRGSLMMLTGRGRRSLRGLVATNSVSFFSDTPYMGLHNTGGRVKITPRMRKFFWAMYYSCSNKKTYSIKSRSENKTKWNRKLSTQAQYWQGLALTKKSAVTIPKRKVIGDHPRVQQIVHRVINDNLRQHMNLLAEVLNRH